MRISDWSSYVCSSDLQTIVGVSVPLPFFDRIQGNLYEASMLAYKSRDDYRAQQTRLLTELQPSASEFDLSKSSATQVKPLILPSELGRASCRERVCKYV